MSFIPDIPDIPWLPEIPEIPEIPDPVVLIDSSGLSDLNDTVNAATAGVTAARAVVTAKKSLLTTATSALTNAVSLKTIKSLAVREVKNVIVGKLNSVNSLKNIASLAGLNVYSLVSDGISAATNVTSLGNLATSALALLSNATSAASISSLASTAANLVKNIAVDALRDAGLASNWARAAVALAMDAASTAARNIVSADARRIAGEVELAAAITQEEIDAANVKINAAVIDRADAIIESDVAEVNLGIAEVELAEKEVLEVTATADVATTTTIADNATAVFESDAQAVLAAETAVTQTNDNLDSAQDALDSIQDALGVAEIAQYTAEAAVEVAEADLEVVKLELLSVEGEEAAASLVVDSCTVVVDSATIALSDAQVVEADAISVLADAQAAFQDAGGALDTDPYTANIIGSYESLSTSDITNAAYIYYSKNDKVIMDGVSLPSIDFGIARAQVRENFVDIPLLITGVQTQMSEYSHVDAYIGDIFTTQFYGKSPITYSITAKVLNTTGYKNGALENIPGVELLKTLYRGLLRLKVVAKYKIAPYITFTGCTIRGPFLSLDINYSNMAEDFCEVQFQVLAIQTEYLNPDNSNDGIISARVGATYLDINYTSDGTLAVQIVEF